MKVIALFALFALCAGSVTEEKGDRTITKVVKLLQGMMDKSVAEGDEERKIYAKFKCYCDQNEAEKKASIEAGEKTIALLESQIEEIQGDTGGLSSECADLKAKMADNQDAQDEANHLRDKEKEAFDALHADLTEAIADMKRAIETLTAVGADQTSATGADNKQFMAGKKVFLLKMQTQVQHALTAASALMNEQQHATATAFLQSPFTGTYTSQSAVVMGIIKSMRDTFMKNLEDAETTEKNAIEAHGKFIKLKKEAYDEMSDSYDEKQKALGGNDGELGTKEGQLSDAKKQLASDEEFLAKLVPMCEEKAKGYANRKMLRANEEAAIAEAISILNSDDAFASFGKSDATSTGATGFLQLRSVRRHMTGNSHVRRTAQNVLEQAAKKAKSARLSKVANLLQGENPFDTVLGEIVKMLDLIDKEGKADQEKLDWCNSERKENDKNLAERKSEITSLEDLIDKLEKTIGAPSTGLKDQIAATEESLVENKEAQTTETADRTEENLAYQQDVKNLVKAESILTKALKVLDAYYDDLEKKLAAGEAFVQEDPTPPEAWAGDGAYAGQSSKGGDVTKMLEFILDETKKEETKAHEDEEAAQASYEDSMTDLKDKEAKSEKELAQLQESLAEKEKDLLAAQKDLKDTTADKESIEAYLLKIKPGCDFITSNFDQREKNRATESAALNKATDLIKGTPAYKTAVNEATVESYGDCKKPCEADAAHVKCKACMADVTIPGYCAGHESTKGC